jgi:hypothetical protein
MRAVSGEKRPLSGLLVHNAEKTQFCHENISSYHCFQRLCSTFATSLSTTQRSFSQIPSQINSQCSRRRVFDNDGVSTAVRSVWAIYSSNVKRSETFIMRVIIQMKILRFAYSLLIAGSRLNDTASAYRAFLSAVFRFQALFCSPQSARKWLLCSLHRKST